MAATPQQTPTTTTSAKPPDRSAVLARLKQTRPSLTDEQAGALADRVMGDLRPAPDTTQRADVSAAQPTQTPAAQQAGAALQGAMAQTNPSTPRIIAHAVGSTIADAANFLSGLTGPPQPRSPEADASYRRGAAFWASFIPGAAVAKIPVAPSVAGLASKFLVGQALGGAVYGAIADGTLKSAQQNAALFAVTGGMLAGIGKVVAPAAKIAKAATDIATTVGDQPLTTAARAMTDAQLAAQPMGATPPLAQSFAAPGNVERRASQAVDRMLGRRSTDVLLPPHQLAMGQAAVEAAVAKAPVLTTASPEVRAAALSSLPTLSGTEQFGQIARNSLALEGAAADQAFMQAATQGGHVPTGLLTEVGTTADKPLTGPLLDKYQVAARLKQEQLEQLGRAAAQVNAAKPPGAPPPVVTAPGGSALNPTKAAVASRLVAGGVGAGLYGIGYVGDETGELPSLTASFFKFVGAAMALTNATGAAMQPLIRKYTPVGRALGKLDPGALYERLGVREGGQAWLNMRRLDTEFENQVSTLLQREFKTPAEVRGFADAVVKREDSKYWGIYNERQQQLIRDAASIHDFHGRLLAEKGLINEARENYMTNALKPVSKGGGGFAPSGLSQSGPWAKHALMPDPEVFREWATKAGLQPEENGVKLFVQHLRSTNRALSNQGFIDYFQRIGGIQDLPAANLPAKLQNLPEGWAPLQVAKLAGKMAPTDIAGALNAAADKSAPDGTVAQVANAAQGAAMRTIMFSPLFHTFNEFRVALGAGLHSIAGMPATLSAIKNGGGDAALYAASRGLKLGRPSELHDVLDGAFAQAGHAASTRAAIAKVGGKMAEWNDKILWDYVVNGLQTSIFYGERAKWMGRNASASAPALRAAEERIADYANTAVGKVTDEFRSPRFKFWLRQTTFAPNWLESRARLTAMATKNINELAVVGNGVPLGDALYAKFKVRQYLWAAGMTYGLSYALTGQKPSYNPTSGRFYAHTGIYDEKGAEMGFDPAAWFQDDFRAAGHPLAFAWGKASVPLRVAADVVFPTLEGKSTPGQAIEGTLQQLGGLPISAKSMVKVATGDAVPEAQQLRDVSALTGMGPAAKLPTPMKVTVAEYAKQALTAADLETTPENVRRMASLFLFNYNKSNGQTMYGSEAAMATAYQKALQAQGGGRKVWAPLWRHAAEVVRALREQASALGAQ